MTRVPRSTYRVQLSERFTLFDAADTIPYLCDLGADWIYLSPVLESEPGSTHGYDVVDHGRIDDERGGKAGWEELVGACRSAGVGILVDIVPNHVGVATPRRTAWWWSTLRDGRDSQAAESFDIDWDFGGGRLRIPVLADDRGVDDLTIEGDALHYHEHRFPIAAGTADDGVDARTVHDRQHYELVDWRREQVDLNYRRFFAVSTLAGIRVERQPVFEASHSEIVRWFRDGEVDGLRIDHPDGLADPAAYLRRLTEHIQDAYVVVEKILEGEERLPLDWPVAGTTGYEALGDFDRVLVDPAGEAALERLDGESEPFAALVHASKREVSEGMFRPEVARLVRELGPQPRASAEQLTDAVAELLTCFPVYRSYLPHGSEHLLDAARAAAQERPDLVDSIDLVVGILSDPSHPAARRFQQTSGMVMAKGVEDRAFYRFNRLTSLNEVGSDPAVFSVTPAEFHARQERRLSESPESMTTLSTHDTKRGEDTRARIDVLSEVPREWASLLSRLSERAPLGDASLENLLWQAIVGAWPASRDRLHGYAEKAAREAALSTSWDGPDSAFEERMHGLIDLVFDDSAIARLLEDFVESIRAAGWSNSLSAKLLQLTAPGVPDVYQGSELWETSLVDPDNRRDVDFEIRRRILDDVRSGACPPIDESGAAKLAVVNRTLLIRREHPELFTVYRPFDPSGSAASHAIAFDRGGAVTIATRLPVSLLRDGGWGDTTLDVSGTDWVDVISGRTHTGSRLRVADLLGVYPVALLVPAGFAMGG